ncbi:MAG: ribosome recycling factor [Verrucomicrobiia bacterium]
MSVDEILLNAEEGMEKTLHKVQEEFGAVRTGKASPQLVDGIRVDAYGTPMRLRELAGITTPEPRLIVIQPWDAANVDPIRKALEESKLGITPLVDGKIIRIPIPELSEDRRRELIKVTGRIAEDGRVAIRHHRRESLDELKKAQKGGEITEDELEQGEKEVQKLTDTYVEKINSLFAAKEAELLKV